MWWGEKEPWNYIGADYLQGLFSIQLESSMYSIQSLKGFLVLRLLDYSKWGKIVMDLNS